MPSYQTSLNTWGANGEEPPTNYSYEEGEQPVDAWDNWFNSNVVNDIEHLINLTNGQLDSSYGSSRPSSPEDGEQFYNTGNGSLDWWNHIDTTWEEAFPKSGGTINGGVDVRGSDVDIENGLRVSGGDFPNDYTNVTKSGSVDHDEVLAITEFEVPDNHRVVVTQATLTEDGLSTPVTSGMSLGLVEREGSGTDVGDGLQVWNTFLSGDGNTVYVDEDDNGDPWTHVNQSGSDKNFSIILNNGTAGIDGIQVHGEVTMYIEEMFAY